MEKSQVFSTLVAALWMASVPVIAQSSSKTPVPLSDISHFITKCTDKRNYCISHKTLVSASSRSFDNEGDDAIHFESEEFKTPPANASESTFPTFCQCDSDCSFYEDCCLDSEEARKFPDVDNATWTCLPLTLNEFNHLQLKEKASMYMINSCPYGSDDIIQSKCLQKESALYDYSYLMDIPVFSKKTRRMYGNIYCAQCNQDYGSLETWNVTIQYNDENLRENLSQPLREATYVPKERRWMVHANETTTEYALVINDFRESLEFINLVGGRHCIQAIDECASDWQHEKHKELCESYAFYVETTGGEKVYKNPHCARCNGVPDEEIHCYGTSGTSFRAFYRPGHYDYSFSLLMNFNWKKQCTDKEVFDPIREVCQPFFCGMGFLEHNGTCVRKEDQIDFTEAFYLNSSCPRVNLTRGVDFEYLDDGSLILLESRAILEQSEYEPTEANSSTVQVCAVKREFFGYSRAQRIVSDVCLSISVVCLIVHIILFSTLPNTRNLPGKNLLSLSFSLFFAHLLFLLGINARETIGYWPCAAVGALIHWFYLAAFFWMNVMGFEIWKTFANTTAMISHHNSFMSGRRRSTFILYSAYAWITPTLIVALGLGFDFTHLADTYAPSYGSHFCWIGNKAGLALFFILPMAVLLTANFIFFAITAWTIVQHRRSSKPAKLQTQVSDEVPSFDSESKKGKKTGMHLIQSSAKKAVKLQIRFMLYVKLALIMGLGWMFGFIAGLADRPELWYLFILLNALQGAFIFIAFSCKQKTIDTVRNSINNSRHRFAFKTSSNIRLTNSAVQTLSFTPATTSTSLN